MRFRSLNTLRREGIDLQQTTEHQPARSTFAKDVTLGHIAGNLK